MRGKRIRSRLWTETRRLLEEIIDRIALIELEATVGLLAGAVAERHRLRAGDAVHLASALAQGDRRLVVASWDGELRRGALESGLAVFPARVP